MTVFSYDELKAKARREIDRLIEAEKALNPQAAIDHALNAAFTIYHLIEWGWAEGRFAKAKSAHAYAKAAGRELGVLHNVVTCQKHVTVDMANAPYAGVTDPGYQDNIGYLATEDGAVFVTQDGAALVTEGSNIQVYFGDLLAVDCLAEALSEFV